MFKFRLTFIYISFKKIIVIFNVEIFMLTIYRNSERFSLDLLLATSHDVMTFFF